MSLEMYGYSERGMVNAVCDDILHSPDPLAALVALLSWCKYPFQPSGSPDFSNICNATILVEQGFSDFGDLDLLVLLDHSDGRLGQAVLFEAKVRPNSIRRQWQSFLAFMNGDKKKRSTLIVQLYRKMRLIRHLEDRSVPLQGDAIWGEWRFGTNRVVLKAADKLKEYRLHPWYVALVPDNQTAVGDFFINTLWPSIPQLNLSDWTEDTIKKWGYLTWPRVKTECKADEQTWKRSTATFSWNGDQIFAISGDSTTANPPSISVGELDRLADELVYVVTARAGEANCRIVSATTLGDYFPATSKVPKANLNKASEAVPFDLADLRPHKGRIYQWSRSGAINPRPKSPIPVPPKRVKVIVSGWKTSQVRQVNDEGHELGEAFHVYTHDLCRA